jgi:hypothetical protein
MAKDQVINTEQVVGTAVGMQKQGEALGNGVVEFLSKQTPPEEPFLGSKYSVIILVAVLFAARYAFNNPDKVKLMRDFIRDPKATLKAIQEKRAKDDEAVDEQVAPAAPSKSTEFLNNTLSVFSLINKGQGSRFWLFLILAIIIVFASMAPVMLPIFTQLRK